MKPYQILEVANSHGGNIDYIFSLIEEFSCYEDFGIKFQPLHPDKIATPDFSWYHVYQQLFFDPEQWKEIFLRASQTKDIWLDLFDVYGTSIFVNNKDLITGIKLQPSILRNESVLSELEQIDLADHVLIINVSGLEIPEIHERLKSFRTRLAPKEIWIEVGFQAYPTQLLDCGYRKIETVKELFDCRIVFADHAEGTSDDAIWLPIFAAMKGADVIEKHICHSSLQTKYDYFSSINVERYKVYIDRLRSYLALMDQPFINEREKKYLRDSIQVPISKTNLSSGMLVDFRHDLDFKRSGLSGLNAAALRELQSNFGILRKNVEKGNTFRKEDFKKATIATIIACRLKSSRLKKKALLKIGDLSSVERCIQSCLRFDDVNHTVLATSDLPEDAELMDYTYSPSVIFFAGDADDVISRYLAIVDQLRVDVVIRVTADMPYVSSEIVQVLLQSHFETGADYTAVAKASVGTAAEIINAAALRKIKAYFPSAEFSEYMTWYFRNNPEYFKLNIVDLPPDLVRDYRLTLDYAEDLKMFNELQRQLIHMHEDSLAAVFRVLDENPEIPRLNSHLTLRYQDDKELIATLDRKTKIPTDG